MDSKSKSKIIAAVRARAAAAAPAAVVVDAAAAPAPAENPSLERLRRARARHGAAAVIDAAVAAEFRQEILFFAEQIAAEATGMTDDHADSVVRLAKMLRYSSALDIEIKALARLVLTP